MDRLGLGPLAGGLVDQQRHAAGGVQHRGSSRPCRLLRLIQAEDLDHLVQVERAEPSARDDARVQPLDQRFHLR
jgi:hypothetical protein